MLKKLCEISAPASGEGEVIKFLINELKDYTDSNYTDKFGNLIFEISGEGEKKVIECGIDEPFLMATDGEMDKIRFSAPPHFKDVKFSNKAVISSDGISLKILSDTDEEKCKFSDLYADKENISPECGKLFTIFSEYTETKNSFVSENLIYKAPAYAVAEAIKTLRGTKKNICFLFSVNKCLAARGLRAYLSGNSDTISVVSVGCVNENKKVGVNTGEGAIICAKEKNCVPSVELRKKLCEIAKKNGVSFSVKLISENLNLKSVLTTSFGAECGFLGICFKENHTNGYEILKNDIKNVTKLVISYCKE